MPPLKKSLIFSSTVSNLKEHWCVTSYLLFIFVLFTPQLAVTVLLVLVQSKKDEN